MTGGWLDAQRARDYDLVQAVVPSGGIDAELRRWTDHLSRIPPKQAQTIKAAIHRQYELMGLAEMELVRNRTSGLAARGARIAEGDESASGMTFHGTSTADDLTRL